MSLDRTGPREAISLHVPGPHGERAMSVQRFLDWHFPLAPRCCGQYQSLSRATQRYDLAIFRARIRATHR